ncbi:MAG: 2-hydroxyacyl-CoA dehydratase family protein [Desulfobacterales bacterium]|nr:2-hydroxyacyl-CoA dehydratase family protein [Desulfobacterales bacterium]
MGEKSGAGKLSALEELTTLPLRSENPYIRNWKDAGGKVFGYTCSYVPEEVLAALEGPSRILPIRLGGRGAQTTEDADIHMHKFLCSYSRSLIQLGMKGQYGFLDGVVVTSGCETMRRTHGLWKDVVGIPFVSLISVPHATKGENRVKWYREEIDHLESDVCEAYALRFSEESLRKTIKTYNEYRRLMHELYDLRKLDQPKVTGSEVFNIIQAGFSMPKNLFNEKLKEAIAELKARPVINNTGARIMLGGSDMGDPYLIDLIESLGATVVTDSLCAGRKYIDKMVDEGIDPMAAIMDRYFTHMPCPRMLEATAERLEFVKKMALEARVDGVIFQKLAFCDNYAGENLMHRKALEADGIPVMEMELEYIPADKGRFKTRIQAFLEKIGK